MVLSLATAAQAADRHALDLPAGRLGDVLVELGRQADVSVGISDPVLAARRVRAVRGQLTAEQALQRLLAGVGARYVTVDEQSFRIVAAPVQVAAAARKPPPPPPVAPLPTTEVEGVIVAAKMQPSRLGAYPGAIEIIEAGDPELSGPISGSEALSAGSPSITSTHHGPGRNKLFIRGIADSGFNGPTQSTVGNYFGETRLNYNAPDPDLRLYDIDQAIIMEGPQGTLYGAGSLGGVIRLLPNRPRIDVRSGSLSFGASSVQHGELGAELAGTVNLPVIPNAAAVRLVGYAVREGGYIDDTLRDIRDVNQVDILGGRAAFRGVTPGDWIIDLGVTGQTIQSADSQFADYDAPPLTRESSVAQPFRNDYLLTNGLIGKWWGDMRFAATVGYVRQDLDERYDATLPGMNLQVFDQLSRIRLWTAESWISQDREDGTGWIVGGSLIGNTIEQRRETGSYNLRMIMPGVQNDVQEAAAFGEARFSITPRITLTAGARATRSKLSGEGLNPVFAVVQALSAGQANRIETSFLPALAITGAISDNLVVFGRRQQSFRPGGLAISGDLVRLFRNDRLETTEIGFRYSPPDGGLEASAALAFTEWQDIQADTISFTGFPITTNVGDGRIKTAEMKIRWRATPAIMLDGGISLNDSELIWVDPAATARAGLPIPNVADVNAQLGASYATRLADGTGLRLSAAARYTGNSILGVGPLLEEEQGGWTDVQLGGELDFGDYTFTASVSNVLDQVGNRFSVGSPFTLQTERQATPMRPRTLQIGWRANF